MTKLPMGKDILYSIPRIEKIVGSTDWNIANNKHKYKICFKVMDPLIKDKKGIKVYIRNNGIKNQ